MYGNTVTFAHDKELKVSPLSFGGSAAPDLSMILKDVIFRFSLKGLHIWILASMFALERSFNVEFQVLKQMQYILVIYLTDSIL